MGFIVKNRLIPGNSVVDGNNPYTIQGHPVSTRVVGQQTGIRDYMDLTDHILAVPRELSHYRYDSPLMGGSLTVKNHSGPVNDYLATQYLTAAPPQGYMGPENRPAETPEITIGKGGTFDVKLGGGSIWDIDTVKALNTQEKIKKDLGMELYYNLTDFDDPNAPALPLKLEQSMYSVEFPSPKGKNKENLSHVTGRGRIVGIVNVNDSGRNFVNHARTIFANAGGHPCEIQQTAAWFELEIIEKPEDKPWFLTLLGASQNATEPKKFTNLYTSDGIPGKVRVPAERIFLGICTNSQTAKENPENLAEYVYVPIWDIQKIETKYDDLDMVSATVTFSITGKPTIITIGFGSPSGTSPSNARIVPSRPIALYTDTATTKPAEHPFFPESVIPYFRTTLYPRTGGNYQGDLKIKAYLADDGKWAPNKYVAVTFDGMSGKTASLPLAYIPRVLIPRDPKTVAQGDTVAIALGITGPKPGVTFAATDTLPKDLKFDTATGAISGKVATDAEEKDYTVTITAKYDGAEVDKRDYVIKVAKKPAVYKSLEAKVIDTDESLENPENYVVSGVMTDGTMQKLTANVDYRITGPNDGVLTFILKANESIKVSINTTNGNPVIEEEIMKK